MIKLKVQLNSQSFRQDEFETTPCAATIVREQRRMAKNFVSSFVNLAIQQYIMCLILSLPLMAYGEIINTNSLIQINNDFTELNKNYFPKDILLIIGVDKVMFKTPISPIEQHINKQLSLNALKKDNNLLIEFTKIFKQIKPSHMRYLNEILLIDYKNELLDPYLPQFIKEVQNNGVRVVAISTGLTGNFNNIKHLEIWRTEYLKKFNLNFSDNFVQNNYITFNNMKPFQNTYPMFYNGVLSSNTNSPFQLILNFLIYINFMPKLLIVIDNNLNELTSIESQIKNYNDNVKFIGYHYIKDGEVQSKQIITENYLKKLLNELVIKINSVKRNNVVPKTNKNQKNISPYDNKK